MKAYIITDLLAYMEKEYKEQGCLEHAEAIHQAISIIRSASHDDDDPISEPARGQLFPLMKRAKLSLEEVKAHLLKNYGICSTKAIPWGLYDDICSWLSAQDPLRKFEHKTMGQIHELPSLEDLQTAPTPEAPAPLEEPKATPPQPLTLISNQEPEILGLFGSLEEELQHLDDIDVLDHLELMDDLEYIQELDQLTTQPIPTPTNPIDPIMRPPHRRRRPRQNTEETHAQEEWSRFEF